MSLKGRGGFEMEQKNISIAEFLDNLATNISIEFRIPKHMLVVVNDDDFSLKIERYENPLNHS